MYIRHNNDVYIRHA